VYNIQLNRNLKTGDIINRVADCLYSVIHLLGDQGFNQVVQAMKMTTEKVKAWAISKNFDWGTVFLGKYCFRELKTRNSETYPTLFYTRKQAREAKKICCYKDAVVRRVEVTIKQIY